MYRVEACIAHHENSQVRQPRVLDYFNDLVLFQDYRVLEEPRSEWLLFRAVPIDLFCWLGYSIEGWVALAVADHCLASLDVPISRSCTSGPS